MARVFLGIPTLNRPEFVQQAIESVRAQTFGDFRALVSDNASAAGVAERIEGFLRELGDDRFSFHRQARNVGEYGQGRLFMQEAKEDYFVILHDDDVLAPSYLERAVARLDSDRSLACFAAGAYLMREDRAVLREETRAYRIARGREGRGEGVIDVLDTLFGLPAKQGVEGGFIPISGTCFRRSALVESGFVDPHRTGNYPFEFDVLVRLGERGGRAWYCPEELVGFRCHTGSMTSYIRITENPLVMDGLIELLAPRRFSGAVEKRRRMYLARYLRAGAMIRARRGDNAGARRMIIRSLRARPASPRAWALAPALCAAPGLVRAALPPLPDAPTGPPALDAEVRAAR